MIKHYGEEPTEDTGRSIVATHDNHIYFYGEINDESQLDFIMSFNDVVEKLTRMEFEEHTKENLFIHINSMGGDFSDSMAMYDLIKSCPINTVGIIEGKCYSGAIALLLGCKEKCMTKNSVALMHEVRTTLEGITKFTDLKDEFETCDKLLTQYKTMLVENTDMDIDNLGMLKHDIVLTSDECLKLKIVDKII